VFKHILINSKTHIGKVGRKTADWENSIKEAKCHKKGEGEDFW
jgi:hypothetical protein